MILLKNIRLTFLILCVCVNVTNAQIAVTNNPPFNTAQNLVENIFLGEGIVASNFTWQNGPQHIGYFDGFSSNIGFEEGLIMSTGGINFVADGVQAGLGMTGDPDLEQALSQLGMSGFSVNNVTILEFDFVAQSDEMSFWYSFGSREYTSYTCSGFNDVFGFFISGPGITGPYTNNATNLALVPDPTIWTVDGDGNFNGIVDENLFTTTPVTINTVNNGDPNEDWLGECESLDPNWESYNIYWVDNDYSGNGWQGVNPPPDPEFTVQGLTGFTVPLPAYINNLVCDETYHIKLAIADCADFGWNSAVFLEANSFSSPNVQISTVPNTELGLVLGVDNGVLEGCGEAALQFERSGDMNIDLNITLEYGGEAIYGVDYEALPTEMVLPAFEDQIILPINVLFDEINEGSETLIITVSGVPVPCEVDETVQDIEIIIFDQEELVVDVPDQLTMDCLGSANIEASIGGGYPPYTYTWTNADGDIIEEGELIDPGIVSINQSPSSTTFYNLVVIDDCLDQMSTTSTDVIVSEQELFVTIDDDIVICQDDISEIVINPDINGGLPPYNYTWFYDGVVISDQAILSSLPGEGLYQFIAQEACGEISGDEIMVSFIELAPYVELISYDVLDPTLLPESCFESVLQFNVPQIQNQDISLDINVGGSAEIGVDYTMETSVVIPAGEDVFYVPISIIVDQEDEEVETIELNFPFIDVCSNWPTQFTIQVYDPPPLSVELDEELVLCEYDTNTGVLEGFVSGGVGVVNYAWYYQDELISTDMDLATNGLDAGLYSFGAIDECNNTSMSTMSFGIIPSSPVVTLSSFDYDDPAQLYEGCGYSTLTFEMPYPYANDTIFYYNVTGSSSFFNGSDVVELVNYIEVPAGVSSVSVDIVPLLDNLNEYTETIFFQFPFSTYCVPQEDIEVYINNYSPVEINLIDDQILCSGQSLELQAEYIGGMPPFDVTWTYVNDTENSNSIEFDVLEGTYPAIFTVTDGCGPSTSIEVMIEGVGGSNFEVTWPPNEVFACFGDNSEIHLNIEGGLPPFTFLWTIEGVETSMPSPSLPWNDDHWMVNSTQVISTLPLSTPETYQYEVFITDSCGNPNPAYSYIIDVTIDDCLLPTSFTPNGDYNNDVFWVEFGDLVGPVSLEVFNRWGSLVFRSDDYTPCVEARSDCWDGSHFQGYGEECPEGIYYYVFTYSHPIYNVDEYDVSNFVDGVFGLPRERSMGSQRAGSLLLIR